MDEPNGAHAVQSRVSRQIAATAPEPQGGRASLPLGLAPRHRRLWGQSVGVTASQGLASQAARWRVRSRAAAADKHPPRPIKAAALSMRDHGGLAAPVAARDSPD